MKCKIWLLASPSGNRTPVSRVTGGDTHHYTNEDNHTVGSKVAAQEKYFAAICVPLKVRFCFYRLDKVMWKFLVSANFLTVRLNSRKKRVPH